MITVMTLNGIFIPSFYCSGVNMAVLCRLALLIIHVH